jgi:lipoprotein-anchoring transpeptidase ErfK/SrfK
MIGDQRNAVPATPHASCIEIVHKGKASFLTCGRCRAAGVVVLVSTAALVSAVVVGLEGGRASSTEGSSISLDEPRVVVLKSKRVLHLLDGESLIRSYPIDLGVSPVGAKERQGDGRTPLGGFRVVTKNRDSIYHRFLGIDYPDSTAVDRGLARGLISRGEAASIRSALREGRCPDWGTALGGGIGIHGARTGRDSTAGCIALSDEHVDELFSVLRIGDSVEIRP